MDVEYIRALYEYNRWANARVLAAASSLGGELFVKDLGSSYRSVRDTLTHILTSEWVWLERWNGNSPRAILDPASFLTVDVLKARWAKVERDQLEFLRALSEDRLETVVRYVNFKGETWEYPLWQQMVHGVNHSTYHRGQVTTMLRQLGAAAVATDFLVFYDEKTTR